MFKIISYFKKNSLFVVLFVAFLTLIILFRSTYTILLANAGWIALNKGMAMEADSELERGQFILEDVLQGERKQRYFHLGDAYLNPENLVKNGSFEYLRQDWIIQGADGVIPQITDHSAYRGQYSLNISFPGKDVNFYETFQEVSVIPGTCYLLQALIKTENMTDGVALEIWDAEGGYQNWYGGRTDLIGNTTNWRPVALQFCVEDDIETIQIRIRRYGGKGQPVSGTVWLDDIFLSTVSANE